MASPQILYFFLADYYYKDYILKILIDRIDINNLNCNTETIYESFSLKNYILSLICMNRFKNRKIKLFRSKSTS